KPLPEVPKALASAPGRSSAPPPAAAGASIGGSISIAPQVASKIDGSETLFVFAREEGGPRMPLAVLKASARQLPLVFALDDSMAMTPAGRISQARSVRVEARISRSGSATPQPGDLTGTSAVVKPGTRDVKIVVDRVLP